jgi:chemotaxis protein MotA
MKAITGIGIAVGLGGLMIGAMMEGSSIPAFFNVPALLIILGGTLGATMAGTRFERIKAVPMLYKKALTGDEPDLRGRVEEIVAFAETARREGLLALDAEVNRIEDDFTRKGMQLVVDGTDPELIREILENEIDGMAARHHAGTQTFEKAGGYAPTMGVLGTVMGLVHVLENLDKPETLGPAISGAFIATLYGVGSANMIFLPVANKLKEMSAAEAELRTMTLEGILAVQAGDNPRVVADKLLSFVPPAEREAEAEVKSGAGVPIADAEPVPA